MDLPNYFLADLPPEAGVSEQMMLDACETLRKNGERYLRHRTTSQVVRLIAELSEMWREPEYPMRKRLLQACPEATGFTSQTMAWGLDEAFGAINSETLIHLLRQDLGHEGRLDGFRGAEESWGRQSTAVSPGLILHVTAGNIPISGMVNMLLGLLLRSPQIVKCNPSNQTALRFFAHSIYEMDAKVGSCIEVVNWRGGEPDWERTIFSAVDLITATGSDEALNAIRTKVPRHRRVVSYGHKVSFALVTKEALSGFRPRKWAEHLVADTAAWDQHGCLSPHLVYVEEGGATAPEQFAELIAEEFGKREISHPRCPLPVEIAAGINSRRGFYEVRAAYSPSTRVWKCKDSTAWTVVYEQDPQFQISCLNRFLYVKPVVNLTEVLSRAEVVRDKISTVGLAASEEEGRSIAKELARWGVPRVTRLGSMQRPPIAWRHDGRPPIGDWITWCDWETGT